LIIIAIAVIASRWLVAPAPQFHWSGDPTPPANLDEAVTQVFAGQRCVTAADAERKIQARLTALGFTEWKVSRGLGVVTDGCVSAGIDTANGVVHLTSSLRPEVSDALAAVANDLIDRCLGRQGATMLVRSVLNDLGETNWEIQVSGMVGGPLDRLDEIKQHALAGCFVYSGTGMAADGTRLFFIGGLDAEETLRPSSRESIAP
jgi:hypothetical protein